MADVEPFADVVAAHVGVVEDLLAVAPGEDAPLADQVAPIGHLERLAELVIGQQDADPVRLGQVADRVLDLADGLGVDPRERLVEHDQLRLGDQRARDLQPAPLAAGDAVGLGPADGRQAELVEQLVLPVPALPAAHRAGLEDGHQVVFDRELLEDARILREVAHARLGTLVHGQARDVPAVEDDLAAVGVDQADRHAEAGGLARPVGAEQADDLAPRDLEVDPVDDLSTPVPLLQAADFQQGHASILLECAESPRGAAGRSRPAISESTSSVPRRGGRGPGSRD